MRLGTILLVVATLTSGDANAQDRSPEDVLGQSLVDALVSKDVVAYSQCWMSSRRMLAMMKELGVSEMPADKLREYHSRRNKAIAESFMKIQKLIDDANIDRKSIRLKTCKPSKIQQRKAPKGMLTQTNQFSLLLAVGDDEWRFEIDDGVLHDGLWYFTDSPINLFAGNQILSFRDHSK